MGHLFETFVFGLGLFSFLIGCLLGYWVITKFTHQGKNILGAIFFIWSVNGLANTILYGPLSNEFQAAIFRVAMPIYFILPSLTYLYVRQINDPTLKLKRQDLAHGIPVVLIFLELVPYYILPFEQKVDILKSIKENPANLFVGHEGLLGNDVRDFLLGVLFMGYGLLIWRIIAQRFKQNPNTPLGHFKWSIFVAVMVTALFILKIAYFGVIINNLGVSAFKGIFTQVIIIHSVFFYTLCGFIWINRREIGKMWSVYEEVFDYSVNESEPHVLETVEIEPEVINNFETYINLHKPYLRAKYSLNDVAYETNLPAYQISNMMRVHYGMNFSDYINSLRIEEVKRRLSDDEYQNYSIEGISKDCGFNAKSTFFTVFKKHTGLTPSEFQKNIKMAIANQ
ncbi:AraC family transcriptional regulator [Cellulophaga sp. BC115SP]|uniref:helix-turn-helix domain-containing protein n=1 Tax=Cellulophaga sp. BC115SP TaxID=2683263 RepID=UPI00141326BC|nr:response regulator transcription factor [Cellulophaga sp. BC115SP]NBB27853.1 helix-turn-helix domain-containing protein [Cellulophaga sp. BC115SP]